MPPAKGGGVATGHAYQTYQDFSSYEDEAGQNMATGFTGGYGDGGDDAAYDDEYPTQIEVFNCGDFYIYYLKSVVCYRRYCGQ